MSDVVEAEVVEESVVEQLEAHAEGTHSTALEVRPASREVLMPMDTEAVVQGMQAYQELLPKLLDDSDYQQAGAKKFVKKSGWRKIGRAFNLSVLVLSCEVERDHEGKPVRATTIARAMAPNGQVSDADGYCSVDEKRFREQNQHNAKTENDLRATATTRAKNRAISDLVGMGEVSAEEVEDAGGAPSVPVASQQQTEVLGHALNWLLPPERSVATWDRMKEVCGGEITGQVALAVIAVISAHKKGQESDQAQPAPTDSPPPAESGTAAETAPDQAPADTEAPNADGGD